MFYGKLIAGLLGLLIGGPIGLVVGLFIGHQFDRGLGKTLRFVSPENIARIQANFFDTTFLLLGYLAKSDGRVSEQEIAHTESIFSQLRLSQDQRKRAIDLFQRGAGASFQLESTVAAFVQTCGPQRQLQQTLLLFLISLALADQDLSSAERAALERIASLMGFGAGPLGQLLRMAQAQGHFHGAGGTAPPEASLEDAYTALGITADASDAELKRAYRKLMSANHPDKLIAQGLPEDMIKLATEKSQEIQSAYEMVRKERARRGGL